jgi:hypothetical protein
MRKGLIAAFLLVISMQNPESVEAGGFATELIQVPNHEQLVMSYIRQGEQLANEVNMYQNMVRHVTQLPGQTYGPIASDINSLATIVQGGRALAYSLSTACSADVSGIRYKSHDVLPTVSGMVADFVGYDGWRTCLTGRSGAPGHRRDQ